MLLAPRTAADTTVHPVPVLILVLALAASTCAKSRIPIFDNLLQDNWQSYTAIGDSFASGIGFPSRRGYTDMIGTHFKERDYKKAVTGPISDGPDMLEQLQPRSFGSPELVTIHFGIELAPALNMRGCLFSGETWDRRYGPNCPYKEDYTAEDFRHDMLELVEATRDYVNPTEGYFNNRTVVLVGYPLLLERNADEAHCNNELKALARGPESPRSHLLREHNELVRQLNVQLMDIANVTGSLFVDIDTPFQNHRWCSQDDPWLEWAYVGSHADDMLLPNEDGHVVMYASIYKTLWDYTEKLRMERDIAEDQRKVDEKNMREEEDEWRKKEFEWMKDEKDRKLEEAKEEKEEKERKIKEAKEEMERMKEREGQQQR